MEHGNGAQGEGEDCRAALLISGEEQEHQRASCHDLGRRAYEESKKLWANVAPAVFSRTVNYSLNVIMQAFAGHLGDLELASVSFAGTVLVGFNYGLMTWHGERAGDAVQAGVRREEAPHDGGLHAALVDRAPDVCHASTAPYFFMEDMLLLMRQPPELSVMAGRVAVLFVPLHLAFAFVLLLQRFLQYQMKNAVIAAASAAALAVHVTVSWLFVSRLRLGLAGVALALGVSWWAIGVMLFVYVSGGGCPETWNGFSTEACGNSSNCRPPLAS
ncbi:hypothetical protein ACP4OV_020574 [Aristida adscensionis]